MRKWFASLAVLGLSAVATAQTIPVPPVGGLGQSQSIFFDDGVAVTSWKVAFPTSAGDAFNVDFDQLAGGMTATGVAMNTYQSISAGPIGIKYVMLAPDNLTVDTTGTTPDINAPLSILGSLSGSVTITGNPGVSAGFCSGLVGYDLPDVTIGTGGLHAVTTCLTGDSGTWLCSDASTTESRSYFTVGNYSTPAISLGNDLMMRVIGTVNTPGGSAYMTVNNATGVTNVAQTGFLAATLWSSCAIQPTLYIQGVTIPSFPFFQVPPFILATGYDNGSPNGDPTQGTVGDFLSDPSSGPCIPAGVSFDVSGFYLDNCDLKKNGKPKLKATNAVTVNVTPSLADCNPCVCFGQRDDGSLDSNIWKVQNPAGSRDYFNVQIGGMTDPFTGNPCPVTTVTSISAASWDFCGSGPSWASVGLYEGSTIDPASPDLGAAVATATTLNMAPFAADFSFPGTTYDFPDLNTSTTVALASLTNGHIAMKWATGDTCTWIASDTDGADDAASPLGGCSDIPNTSSYLTLTGYTSAAISVSNANWMMRVDWS